MSTLRPAIPIPDDAPDLSGDGWPEKFAKAKVRRGRPPVARPKVSTTIRLSPDVIDYFKASGRGVADADRRGASRLDREARRHVIVVAGGVYVVGVTVTP